MVCANAGRFLTILSTENVKKRLFILLRSNQPGAQARLSKAWMMGQTRLYCIFIE